MRRDSKRGPSRRRSQFQGGDLGDESKPHCNTHRDQQNRRVSLTEELAIKARHPAMLIVFDTDGVIRATYTFCVGHFDIRPKQNVIARIVESHTPVQIFTMHEVAFIHRTYLFDRVEFDKHECTGNGFNGRRLHWKGLTDEHEATEARLVAEDFRKLQNPDQGPPRRGYIAPTSRLFRSVRIADETAADTCPRVRGHDNLHALNRIVANQAIGVQKQDKAPPNEGEP